ncbi:MAG: glucose-1-phosphate cytidylyltransferase [Bacteroidetes bacterium]|nr:MAG: glucose-1-phosphate cytidylyltransferase [Bacteroidota bacterium]
MPKVLILAGGLGTRLSEETTIKPKPMVEIGGKPILWHIMKIYSSYGFNEFVILCGYKGQVIKEYFSNYFLHQNDMTIDLKNNKIDYFNNVSEDWKITLIDTGELTMTGGRIKRAKNYINNETFLLTYGDGVSDVNIKEAYEFHKKHKKQLTVTAIQPEARYGILDIKNDTEVKGFLEKPKGESGWINGGFFVCEPSIIDYITDDTTIFERDPMQKIAQNGEMKAFKHEGFWQCMDTIRDKTKLQEMWESNDAPWKLW